MIQLTEASMRRYQHVIFRVIWAAMWLGEYKQLKPQMHKHGESLISYISAELDLDCSEVGRKWRIALRKIYSSVKICKTRCCICIS